MKILRIILLSVIIGGLTFSSAFAMKHLPEERGKTLFNDPKLSGGTSGKSCNTCHPGGKGLEAAGDKKEWKTPAGKHSTMEEAVNTCVTMALKGKALDANSQEMKDIIAYIKSLKTKADKPMKKGY
ncbi:MAG: hypothetical protein HY756_12060 [Nitrospirae bacterium]|nr:hypothetical protein [Nitrospirota bacterium]